MSSPIFSYAADLWGRMRLDFENTLMHAYQAAEVATNGFMVNRDGKARDITGLDLFTGPIERAYTYASEELLEHWSTHPRPALAFFEKTWLDLHLFGGEDA